MFQYTLDNKQYHTFNYYLKNRYSTKVARVSLNAGFTCPNRDGTKGFGGCLFCSDEGSGDFAGSETDSLEVQFEKVSAIMKNKWPDCKYIAYFQAYTNTYGPIEKLKACFEPFVNKTDVVGIDIATRPDCLDEEILNYLENLSHRTDLFVELGLQTIHEQTAQIFNRGYELNIFEKAVYELRKRNINICVHIINGLPFETYEMMLETAKYLGKQDIQGIKIHNLYVYSGSRMYQYMQEHHLEFMSRKQYIDLVVSQLEYIPGHIVIQRLTGDGDASKLFGPLWSIKKVTILNDIDKRQKELNSYQGIQVDLPNF